MNLRFLLMLLIACGACPAMADSVSAKTLLQWYGEERTMLLLDIRGKQMFLAGTIDGAVNAGYDPKGYLPSRTQGAVVLIAPSRADPQWTGLWVKRLVEAGNSVYLYSEGVEKWSELGGPVATHEVIFSDPSSVPFVVPGGICEDRKPTQVFE